MGQQGDDGGYVDVALRRAGGHEVTTVSKVRGSRAMSRGSSVIKKLFLLGKKRFYKT